jgi:hypothetical protein
VESGFPLNVTAGLVAAISIRKAPCDPYRVGRNKSGHDNWKRQPERCVDKFEKMHVIARRLPDRRS